ncbi:Lipase 3 [Melipona quadrifasciata]|uniref:Lipase n=1 Tax=Melipona quadrifasciata TaxID=166423 RepID=A0A0M8ZV62_9HYME|nr:Lipase 3 [Melipona quadrifasciata]
MTLIGFSECRLTEWLVRLVQVIIGVPFIRQYEANEALFNRRTVTAAKIAQQAGYSAESYDVVTQDGYILRMDRITGSKKSPPSDDKTAVLLVHGLFDASPTWLVAGPEKALVDGTGWTKQSLRSVSITWNEMGMYDMPAMIDRIIQETKQEKMFMVTYSQGGTVFLVMASERPEYQKKVIAHFALVPAAFVSRMGTSVLKALWLLADYGYVRIYEFKPSNKLVQRIGGKICRDESRLQLTCKMIVGLCVGSQGKLNMTLLPLVTQYFPSGVAVKQLAHYGQLIQSGKFRKFDYGLAGNIEKYNETNPPDYNLRNVTVPTYLHYATNDKVVDVEDVLELYETLPDVEKFLVPRDVFAHLDFMWGEDANTLVYDKILSLMKRYRK